ncbi:hypothetical protein HBO04_20745 [Pseudomonas proteolytica]|uniref:hypothetical protein n=1 Tax=Pseudomonas proteolytica TaxID=219574 RepID=UPI001474433E|nr:hypothetical protein [Pseudomonas proteolytica]NMZ02553.1 hypothetical protein [Pseudomonas proteolytica]
MSSSSDIEQFSRLWILAGRPELFDPADELAALAIEASNSGVDSKAFLLGYTLAGELGSQSPPGQLLSRLAVYEKVRTQSETADPDMIEELYAAALADVLSYEANCGHQ